MELTVCRRKVKWISLLLALFPKKVWDIQFVAKNTEVFALRINVFLRIQRERVSILYRNSKFIK